MLSCSHELGVDTSESRSRNCFRHEVNLNTTCDAKWISQSRGSMIVVHSSYLPLSWKSWMILIIIIIIIITIIMSFLKVCCEHAPKYRQDAAAGPMKGVLAPRPSGQHFFINTQLGLRMEVSSITYDFTMKFLEIWSKKYCRFMGFENQRCFSCSSNITSVKGFLPSLQAFEPMKTPWGHGIDSDRDRKFTEISGKKLRLQKKKWHLHPMS